MDARSLTPPWGGRPRAGAGSHHKLVEMHRLVVGEFHLPGCQVHSDRTVAEPKFNVVAIGIFLGE